MSHENFFGLMKLRYNNKQVLSDKVIAGIIALFLSSMVIPISVIA